jgi:hypothetical protein
MTWLSMYLKMYLMMAEMAETCRTGKLKSRLIKIKIN